MKRALFLLMPLAVAGQLYFNVLADLNITESKANEVFVKSLGGGMLNAEYDIVKAAKALPADMQAAGIRELIGMAKAYSKTDDFARAYSNWRKERLGYKTKQRGLRMPNIGKMVDKAIDKQLNKAEDEKKLPADPQELIKQRLNEFLELSASVDFNAELRGSQFANPAYEAKSNQWKMCFRAGKPVVDAAREEAQKWLKELEQ